MKESDMISPIEDVLEDARQGRMFILVDAEDRENEGDLVIPAQHCDADAVNFMATHGRGLICLALTSQRARELELKWMTRRNRARYRTAFTISIEAREGVSSGISAHDRAHTIAVAIDAEKRASDLVSPGHMFPLVAREGGVLARAGHTEAAIDIARIAGLIPAGVLCEIMKDDGSMARLPDLVTFAQTHSLKIATIADLIAYRRRHDNFMFREMETDLASRYGGGFRMIVYRNRVNGGEHVALVKGEIDPAKPVLTRVHALNILDDVLGAEGRRADLLARAMEMFAESETGVLVLIRDTGESSVSDAVRARRGESDEDEDAICRLREHGVCAQILCDLGVRDIILLSDTKYEVVALEGYGLRIVGQRPLGARNGAEWRDEISIS